MNLGINCSEKETSLSPRIVPLLVLAKEWGRSASFKEDALLQTDIILLLLQGVQALSEATGKGPSLSSIMAVLLEINSTLADTFTKSLEDVTKELTSFMGIFDHLALLLTPLSDTSPPLLDADCKGSVLGVFVKCCVLEFQCLTFSQIMRFHTQWQNFVQDQKNWDISLGRKTRQPLLNDSTDQLDFTAALKALALSDHDWGKVVLDNKKLGLEALQLAALHGRFGHLEEGMFALHEAIQLAQQNNNTLLLEHTLAWLHKLQPSSDPEEALVILNKFVKNAEELKMPMLGAWGRLQQAKTQILLSKEPTSVFQTLATSETEFSAIYEDRGRKDVQRSCTLAMQAGAWEHYGHRLLGLLYSQLQCHMTSCDPLFKPEGSGEEEQEEAFSLSLCMLARHLAETGEAEKSEALLHSALRHLRYGKLPYKTFGVTGMNYGQEWTLTSHEGQLVPGMEDRGGNLLSQCLEEVAFQRAVWLGRFSTAEKHLRNIATFDRHSTAYRSVLLRKAEGNLGSAVSGAHQLLRELHKSPPGHSHVQLQGRLLVLLAEVYVDDGLPALALSHVMECIALCEKHHLSSHQAKLCLAHIQLQLGSPKDSLATVKDCLLHCQANGSCVDRGKAYFTLAQATLCCSHKENSELTKADVLVALSILSQAVSDFRTCSANEDLKKALTLQAQFYHFVGYVGERDKTARLIAQFHSQTQSQLNVQ